MRVSVLSASSLLVSVAFACSGDAPPVQAPAPAAEDAGPSKPPAWLDRPGERRGPLPKAAPALTPSFATSDACAQCHTASEGVMRDAAGRDVSPLATYRPSMMALAARDPFYLAVVDDERSSRPSAQAVVDAACTRCHAPAGVVELAVEGAALTLPDLMSGAKKEHHLAREGVTCTLCHQLERDARGPDATFGGAFTVGAERALYGPHRDPVVTPMRTFVSYTPTYASHVTSSELCASCHTVFTRAHDAAGVPTGPRLPEQATYLEWRNSIYATGGARGASCQGCHVPTGDDDDAPITAVLSRVPEAGLAARKPVGRHVFVGGNATMLRALASDGGWHGSGASPEELTSQAERSLALLRRAAAVTIAEPRRTARGVEIDVSLENRSGHKLPTGYPSRRLIVHVKVSGPSGVAFESGRTDAFGRLVDRRGQVLDGGAMLPHRDVVTREGDVQVYELVLGRDDGRVVHRPLDTTRYLKDNRLPPLGASPSHPDAPLTVSYGAERDPDFGSTDVVHYVLGGVEAESLVEVELLFQSVRSEDLEVLAERPTATARTLFDLLARRLEPHVIARASRRVP